MPIQFTPALNPPDPKTDDKDAYYFAFLGDKMLHCPDGRRALVPRQSQFEVWDLANSCRHYLGQAKDTACYAIGLDEGAEAPPGTALAGLRDLYPALEEGLFPVAGRAVQIVAWDQTHRFCGRCGAPTQDHQNDRAKKCQACGLQNFPRLSPAIIVRVNDGDRLLLARSPRFPPGRYSVLAGFVEPGETLEEAVAREVHEEVAITVKDIRYFGSQPWPFPNSLMLGFTAVYAGGTLCPDDHEIEDAGWYSPSDLPELPPPMSIARRLIDDFIG
jgi:NAD+ diphosphatase